jgi:hypothetical protein
LILSGHKKRSEEPPKSRDREGSLEGPAGNRFGRLRRHGVIVRDARLAQEAPRAAFSVLGGDTGADCLRDSCGSIIAPIQSERSTRKTHLITFEKALKNV